MASPAPAVHTTHQPHSMGFNLGVITLLVALAGLGFAYVLDAAARGAHKAASGDPNAVLTRTLAGRDLTIPRGWFRYDAEPADGLVKEVDLRLSLPIGHDGQLAPIDVTLLPRSRVQPSSKLLDGVYLHQFLTDQLTGPPGLVGKPLKAEDGFAYETVWYDALSADPFVAKCTRPAANQPAQCLRTVYLGPGIAAVYAFGDAVLENWRGFDAALTPALTQMGAL